MRCVLCLGLGALASGPSFVGTAGAASVYYVDANAPSCSSAGPGTEAEPYCTIGAAVAAHKGSGVTILVKPGIYREQVSIPASGVAGSPFVLQAVGPGVVIEGADPFGQPSMWSNASGDIWLASAVTWPPVQVFVDGARLVRVAPESLVAGTFAWVSGQGLYVNLGGGSPGERDTHVGRRARGFTMFDKSHVTIEGFEISRSEERGVYLQNACSNVTIARNRVTSSGGQGIQGVGGSNLVFEQNVVAGSAGHGISLISGATGCAIRGNESYGNADRTTRVANGIYLFGAPGNTISGNRLHDNQDSGVHIQSGSNGCISFNNVSWHNGDHGFDHLIAVGTVHVCDVAYGNYRDGFSIEGSSTGTRLANCVAVDNGLASNRFDLWVDGNSTSGFTSDYNIFWNSTTRPPIKYVTTMHSSLATYQTASGQDVNTYQTDPRFTDPALGDFQLLPDSPAIDSGDSDAPMWPAIDAEGRGRVDIPIVPNTGSGGTPYCDRGAFERGASAVGVETPAPRAAAFRVFPNPLRTRGTVELSLERPGRLRVQVLDVSGRALGTLVDREAPAGRIHVAVPETLPDGRSLPSGTYFLRVEALGRIAHGRFQVLR